MFMCEMLLLAAGVAHTHFVPAARMELHTPAAALGAKDICRGIFSVLAGLRKCHESSFSPTSSNYLGTGHMDKSAQLLRLGSACHQGCIPVGPGSRGSAAPCALWHPGRATCTPPVSWCPALCRGQGGMEMAQSCGQSGNGQEWVLGWRERWPSCPDGFG